MSLMVPMPINRVSSVKAAVNDNMAVSGAAESPISTMITLGAGNSARYSSACWLPPSRTSGESKNCDIIDSTTPWV